MSQSQTQKQDITLEFKAYTLIGNSLKSQSQMYVKESFSYKSLSIGSLESTVGIIGDGVCLMNSTNRITSSVFFLNMFLCCAIYPNLFWIVVFIMYREKGVTVNLFVLKRLGLYSLNSRESEAQQYLLIFFLNKKMSEIVSHSRYPHWIQYKKSGIYIYILVHVMLRVFSFYFFLLFLLSLFQEVP